jgi:prolyl oligopeptidase
MGDPNTPDGLRALAAQDSYLLLESATDLPDTFVIIGLNDGRVEPWMSAKFAARAQERFGTRRKIYVRADPDAGHGVGSTRSQLIEEWADTFVFAWARVKTP